MPGLRVTSSSHTAWTAAELRACKCGAAQQIKDQIKVARAFRDLFANKQYKNQPKDWDRRAPRCSGGKACKWTTQTYKDFIWLVDTYGYNKALDVMYNHLVADNKSEGARIELPPSTTLDSVTSAETDWKSCTVSHFNDYLGYCFPRVVRDATLIHELTHVIDCTTHKLKDRLPPDVYAQEEVVGY